MKKHVITITLISFISTLYSIDQEWDEAFKKSNFEVCHALLLKKHYLKKDRTEMLLKVNTSIEQIKTNYTLLLWEAHRARVEESQSIDKCNHSHSFLYEPFIMYCLVNSESIF